MGNLLVSTREELPEEPSSLCYASVESITSSEEETTPSEEEESPTAAVETQDNSLQQPQEVVKCVDLFSHFFTRQPSSFLLVGGATDGENDENDDEAPPEESCSSYWRSISSSSLEDSNDEGVFGCSRGTFADKERSSSWMNLLLSEMDYTEEELALSATTCTHESNLTQPRPVWMVTTAALPWMTGTSVNPLLRAAHLVTYYRNQQQEQKENDDTATATEQALDVDVTLVLPWLETAQDRLALYGAEWEEATRDDQDAYIRQWLRDADEPQAADFLKIVWYPARYHAALSSIFAMGDVCERLEVADPSTAVCILEEPEHMNFYRAPSDSTSLWRNKFCHVVGIIHTNYKAYASHQFATGLVTGPIVAALSAWMVRAYCDKVIKLSNVLQKYCPEKEVVENVHGIRSQFLQVPLPTGNRVYFIGKLLWAKGLDRLLVLETLYKKQTGDYFAIDVFGSGPEGEAIQRAYLGTADTTATTPSSSETSDDESKSSESKSSSSSLTGLLAKNPKQLITYPSWTKREPLPVNFLGRVDHAAISTEYKIFVNPSVTEVLCTTTAEALAMNKFCIVPNHPSNEFFQQFPNCLQYNNKTEFISLLRYALSHSPEPLSEELRFQLSWEAATERLLQAAAVSERDQARRERIGKQWDERIATLHYEIGKGRKGDMIRKFMGGGPVADQFQYEQLTVAAGDGDGSNRVGESERP